MFDLKGRVAVVTGGNGGIGLGMARGLAGAGARVAVVARNQDKSRAAVAELERLGAEAVSVKTDVSDEASVAAMTKAVLDRWGRMDILVNNAGTNIRKPAQELSLDEWRHVMDANLTSAFLCSRAAHPAMKRGGGGKIVNIGSMMSIFGSSFASPYSASKGGIVQLTKSMASSWARDNIQVNAILPGWIDTELTRGARAQVPTLHDAILRRTPAGRWGVIDDFNGIAVFLGGPASDFITGAVITVDGGFSIQGT